MQTSDPFNLSRFVEAQEPVFHAVLAELERGRKRSHWMWFIFPQLKGLGLSSTAQFYGIVSLEEAQAYLTHSVLGPRLATCTETVLASKARSLGELFGSPDDLKFCSSMTLFAQASAKSKSLFRSSIDHWCGGQLDANTQNLLAQNANG